MYTLIKYNEKEALCRSVWPRKGKRMSEREREERLVPRGWVPLEITPSIRGQTQKHGPGCASEYPISTSEKLFVHRGQRPVCAYLHARIRERRAWLITLSLSRAHTLLDELWRRRGTRNHRGMRLFFPDRFFRDKDNVLRDERIIYIALIRWIFY